MSGTAMRRRSSGPRMTGHYEAARSKLLRQSVFRVAFEAGEEDALNSRVFFQKLPQSQGRLTLVAKAQREGFHSATEQKSGLRIKRLSPFCRTARSIAEI